jgi:hypothetical protein
MKDDFQLLMLGAMYENGGNMAHRFLDGHPQMYVYPFESQLGTKHVVDHLSSLFPLKYRWPVFDLSATPEQDYASIIDEECKVRARTPRVSKFRHMFFDFSDDERRQIYLGRINETGRSRSCNVAAFFQATFGAWKNRNRTGNEAVYVGYCPIITIDAEKMFGDLPRSHLLHVVRNPWSAYADTKKRAVPMSLENYTLAWTVNQYHALLFKEKYPQQVHIIRAEDLMADSFNTLKGVCERLGLEPSDTLNTISWNGTALEEVYPWGTIRKATLSTNRAAAHSLSERECQEIHLRAKPYLDSFDYKNIV